MGALEDEPLLSRTDSVISYHAAATRRNSKTQAIAHRGFKAKFPENTLAAFEGAIATGAGGLETDLRLSSDGVVMLSHDLSLKRCFGVDQPITACTFDYLRTLRTTAPPHLPMPTLADLLDLLALPRNRHVFLLLDIKLGVSAPIDEQETVIRAIARTLASVEGVDFWADRVLAGCWTVTTMGVVGRWMPEIGLMHIGWSTALARRFLEEGEEGVGFNLHWSALSTGAGRKFLEDARRERRRVWVWTVNEPETMKWAINLKLDGVITDDPEKFLELQQAREGGEWERDAWTIQRRMILWYYLLAAYLVGVWRPDLIEKGGFVEAVM